MVYQGALEVVKGRRPRCSRPACACRTGSIVILLCLSHGGQSLGPKEVVVLSLGRFAPTRPLACFVAASRLGLLPIVSREGNEHWPMWCPKHMAVLNLDGRLELS